MCGRLWIAFSRMRKMEKLFKIMILAIVMTFLLFILPTGVSSILCSQCDSDTEHDCFDDPPRPHNCTQCLKFYMSTNECSIRVDLAFCITERRYYNDTLVRVTRDCSPDMMRDTCNYMEDFGRPYKVCFTTCNTSGCNINAANSKSINLFLGTFSVFLMHILS